MKRNKITTLLALLIICCGSLAFKAIDKAPVAHVGYVNVDFVLGQMPEFTQARAETDTLATKLEAELRAKLLDYQQKQQKFEGEKEQLVDLVKDERLKELGAQEAAIQAFRENATKALQQKQADLTTQLNRLSQAIEKVAEDYGYTHVINTNATEGSLMLYAQEDTNLDSLVMVALDIKTLETNNK